MTNISVIIITLNEERNIGRCLESVNDIADEIVVVDSYSTDDTEKICKLYGVRFIQHRFDGHIEQKNWAINQARYPHILSLDADEVLSPRLKASIRAVKENWEHDGYYFNRMTNYCGKWIRHSSWYPSRKMRLWDSRKGEWGGMNPHDRFILEKGATRKFLKGDLLHYSYYTIHQHIEQINKFSDIAAKSFYEVGRKASWFNILFHPLWRLFRDYIIKSGFMDGFYGLVISLNSAHETFLKYSKLRKLYKDAANASKNRICFFNSLVTWGGGEKWHFDLSTGLAKMGYNVFVYSNPRSELMKKIRDARINHKGIVVSNLSFLNPIKIIWLRSVFRKERVRTLVMNLSSDLKVAGIAAKLAGVDNIIYKRANAIPVRNTFLNRFLYRRIVTRMIANSEETKRTLLARNPNLIEKDKIQVIYNGIDLQSNYLPSVKYSYAGTYWALQDTTNITGKILFDEYFHLLPGQSPCELACTRDNIRPQISIYTGEKLFHPSTVDVFGLMGFSAIGQKKMPLQFFVDFFPGHYFSSKHGSIGIGLPVPDIHTAIGGGKLILKTAGDTGCGLLKLIGKQRNPAPVRSTGRFRLLLQFQKGRNQRHRCRR